MKDNQIIELYWQRREEAISETDKKYGKFCYSVSYNVLWQDEDCKECVNDAYLAAWNSIPPHRPNALMAFLGKIVRNISINRYKFNHAARRNTGQFPIVLEELQECIPSRQNVEHVVDEIVLAEVLNRFLAGLSRENRKIFMRRYWYFSQIKEIASEYSLSESKVKMSLMRSRNALKQLLTEEGILI